MRSSSRQAQHGFTLIELLVASILVSLVLSSVYVLFFSAIGNWRRIEAGFDAQREVRNVVSLMQREFACALPTAGHLMEGEDDEVTFFIVAPPLAVAEREGSQLLRVRYYYNRAGNEIVREEGVVETALPPPGTEQESERSRVKVEDEEEFVVAANVSEFSLRYLWVPTVPDRNLSMPPKDVEVQIAERHKLGWGLPQGLELTIIVEAPGSGEKPYEILASLPTRAPTSSLSPDELASRLRRE